VLKLLNLIVTINYMKSINISNKIRLTGKYNECVLYLECWDNIEKKYKEFVRFDRENEKIIFTKKNGDEKIVSLIA